MKVLYFAEIKEILQTDSETIDINELTLMLLNKICLKDILQLNLKVSGCSK